MIDECRCRRAGVASGHGGSHGGQINYPAREIENQLYRYLTAEQGEGSWEFVPFLGLPY